MIPDSRFYNQDKKVIISNHLSLLVSPLETSVSLLRNPLKTSWNLWPIGDLLRYLKETFYWIPLEDFLESLAKWWLFKVPKRNLFLNTSWRLLWVFLDTLEDFLDAPWRHLGILGDSIKCLKEKFYITTEPLVEFFETYEGT